MLFNHNKNSISVLFVTIFKCVRGRKGCRRLRKRIEIKFNFCLPRSASQLNYYGKYHSVCISLYYVYLRRADSENRVYFQQCYGGGGEEFAYA